MIDAPAFLSKASRPAPLTTGSLRPSLRSNVTWTLAGNFGYALCQWGLLVSIARLTNPEAVGLYALALSIAAPVMMFANLNLRTMQATDTHREYAFSGYFGVRLVTTILALAIIGLVLVVAGYSRATALVIIFVGLAKAAESVSDIYYGMFQQREQMNVVAKSMIYRGVISLVVMTFTISITGNMVFGAASLFVSWIAVLLGFDVVRGWKALIADERIGMRKLWDWRPLAVIAWVSLPLGTVQLLISLNTNVARYFIDADLGKHELGVFAAIAYLVSGVSTGVLAVGNAVSPRLARMFHAQEFEEFARLLVRLILIFAGLAVIGAIGVWWLGDFVLSHIYSEDYAGNRDVLAILTLQFGVSAAVSMLGYGLTAARRFRSQVPLVAVAFIITTVTSAVLIPKYGLIGAAYSSLLSTTVWMFLSALVLQRVVRSAMAAREAQTR